MLDPATPWRKYWTALWLAPALLLATLDRPALADPLFDTTRIIQYHRTECVGRTSQSCQTTRTRLIRVGKGQSKRVTVTCPNNYPYVVGWDAKRHEHLEIVLGSPPVSAETAPSRAKPGSLALAVSNRADAAGSFRIYVGCSTKPFDGHGGFRRAAHAFPSKLIHPKGGKS